jgi:sarcosine oxidase gamma subunit
MLEELVNLKDALEIKLKKEQDKAIENILLEYENKMEFLQKRFDCSVEKVLASLGKTIPNEVKIARKRT